MPTILTVGVGNAGANTIKHMKEAGVYLMPNM